MTSLRYARHVLLCWLYQLQQSQAIADIERARDIQREARKRLHRSVAKECEEKLAFDQYRRVLREVAR